MYNYKKTQVSPHVPTKLATHSIWRLEDNLLSNFGHIFTKTFSFDEIVHFSDEENIVTYVDFDCGFPCIPETCTKIGPNNRERNYISRSCEKPEFSPSDDQRNCSIDEQHTSNIVLNQHTSSERVPAALVSLSHTNDRVYMSNQYAQTTTYELEQTHIRCSLLQTMDCKRKGLYVSIAFLQKIYLPEGRENETVATVEELSDLWKPSAMDGIPPFVMNCNCI